MVITDGEAGFISRTEADVAIIELPSVGHAYRVVLGTPTNTLGLLGAHDDSTVRALRRSLAELIALDDQDLVIDLSEATSLAPGVIAEIVGADEYLSERGRRLIFDVSSLPLLAHGR